MNSSDIQLEHTGQQLQRIVKEAGKLLLSFWRKPIKRMKKEHSIVTEADLASEKLLIERLEILLPQADFWTEESGAFGTNGSGYHWVIDPLDGTRNFASHIPYFADLILGIHHLLHNLCYFAGLNAFSTYFSACYPLIGFANGFITHCLNVWVYPAFYSVVCI